MPLHDAPHEIYVSVNINSFLPCQEPTHEVVPKEKDIEIESYANLRGECSKRAAERDILETGSPSCSNTIFSPIVSTISLEWHSSFLKKNKNLSSPHHSTEQALSSNGRGRTLFSYDQDESPF